MKYGYARVSTSEQDLTIQIEALEKEGCEIIRTEKLSGSSREGRTELATLIEFAREGDVIVVTRVDRLARSMRDLQNIVHELREKGVAIKCTEQPVDTTTSTGKAFLDMLGVFSEMEYNLRAERVAEGIEKARERGVYANRKRKRTIDPVRVREMRGEGLQVSDIARELSCSRMTVNRALNG
jgi:DNA invertase Pin-like site-specific DNA recombinase